MNYFFRTVQLWLVAAMVLAGCSDLAVFVPTNEAPSFSKFSSIEVNEEGRLQLEWVAKNKASVGAYQIFLMEVDSNHPTYQFSEAAAYIAPLTSEELAVDPAIAPSKQGRLLSSVKDLNYILEELLQPGKTYVLQVSEKLRSKKETKAKVILLRIDFEPISAATAVASGETITLSWNAVPGANRYEVYANSEMTELLGSTPINRLVLKPEGRTLQEFYVRALKGALAAKDVIRIELQQSSVAVTKVSSSLPNGFYGPGDTLEFEVTFSDLISVYGDSALPLAFPNVSRMASYKSGSGSNVLKFSYAIQNGDNVERLATGDVLTGEYLDKAGSAVSKLLPAEGHNNTLKELRAFTIDTKAPTAPGSLGFTSSISLDGTASASWLASNDLHFLEHRVKLCGASDCSSSCSAESSIAGTSHAFSSLTEGTYYICAKGVDAVGLESPWTTSLTPLRVDTTPPSIVRAFSTPTSGYFREGQTVAITLEYSENVDITGSGLSLQLNVGGATRTTDYVSGSGSKFLLFHYLVQAGDVSSDLNYDSTSAFSLGGAHIRDTAGQGASLTLPDPGSSNSLAGQSAVVIDTTAPSLPVGVNFTAGAYSSSASFVMSWTASSDTNFKEHRVKLCAQNDCATTCSDEATLLGNSRSMTGVNGGTYYGCVRGEDLAGQSSAWIASGASIQVDTTAPTVTRVSSSDANGSYKEGDTLTFLVYFSENVLVANDTQLKLLLETGTSDHQADYSSGSGSNVLSFTYTVQVGDTATDLDYQSTSALLLGTATVRDAAGLNAVLTLPDLGTTNSLAGQKQIALDTSAPTLPSAVSFPASVSSPNMNITWTASEDPHFSHHNVKICEQSDCSTACTAESEFPSSPGTIVGINGTTYFACVQGEDIHGHTTSWVASSSSALVDNSSPYVTSVTSTTGNGIHTTGATISVSVVFSEAVNVTNEGNFSLLLETGATDHAASYVSGGGSDTLVFEYTVQNGDETTDLDYASTSALTLGGGTIQDVLALNADLNLPARGGPNSIAGQKAIRIDTTAPTNPTSVGFAGSLTNSTSITMSWSNSFDNNFSTHNVKLCTDDDCSTGCVSAGTSVSTPAALTGTHGATYYGCVQGQDQLGATSSWVSSLATITVDTVAPTVILVSSDDDDGSYKLGDILEIKVQFSKPVTVSGTGLSLTLETGATDRVATYHSGSGTDTLIFRYTVQAGDTNADLEAASTTALALGSATVRDAAGNNADLTLPTLGGGQSLSGQKDLLIDGILPTVSSVTSDKADGTWTSGALINIQVTFSEAVTVAGATPSLGLNTTPSRSATYSSGSGGTVLTFAYTVTLGDVATDLDYASASALILNSATIRDASGNNATLTLPAPGGASSLGGSKNLNIRGDSTAPTLSASVPSQNAYTEVAITGVDISSNSGDNDAEGDAVTYACYYDTTVNGTVSTAQSCSGLPSDAYSFNAATGVLAWTPSTAATPNAATRTVYEFKVVGTDTTGLSGSTIFTIAVIRPWSATIGFDAGSSANYLFDSALIDFSGGYARLRTIDQLDNDSSAEGFGGASKYGADWDGVSSHSMRLSSTGGCDGAAVSCMSSKLPAGWSPNSSILADSIGFENNFDGTVDLGGSKPDFQAGKIGSYSAYFSGDDFLAISRKVTDNFTIHFWMKTTQTFAADGCTQFHQGASLVTADLPTSVQDFGISLCDGYVLAGVGNPDFSIKSSFKINDGNWHMVTFMREMTSGGIWLLIDGKSATYATTTQKGSLNANPYIFIGAANTSLSRPYEGYIDELTVTASTVNLNSILEFYNLQAPARGAIVTSRIIDAGITSPWTSLSWHPKYPYGKDLPDFDAVIRNETSTDYPGLSTNTLMNGIAGLWHFNETSAVAAADKSGQGNHGAASGPVSRGQNGLLNKAVYFNSGGYFNLGEANNLSFGTTGSFTGSAWVRTYSTNSRIFSNGISSNSNGWMMRIRAGGIAALGIGCGGGASADCLSIEGTTPINDNHWHHIAVSVNRSTQKARVYVDGNPENIVKTGGVSCGTISGKDIDLSTCPLINADRSEATSLIGSWNGSDQFFIGNLDELAIWSRALSPTEIKEVYMRGGVKVGFQVRTCPTADCSGASYWRGPDGTGNTWFSEIHNNTVPETGTGIVKTGSPSLAFADFPAITSVLLPDRRYFQYRYYFTSTDTNNLCTYGGAAGSCSPELLDVSVGPSPRYVASQPAIVNQTPVSFYTLAAFTETLGGGGCPGGIGYQLSVNGTNWFYWNGTAWAASNGTFAQSTTASGINSNANVFATQVGRTNLYVRAMLKSDGLQACELDALGLSGNSSH